MKYSEDAYDELIGQPWSVREVSRRMQDLRAQGYTANQCYEDEDEATTAAPCIGSDPLCPCQDGDSCHYVDDTKTGTKALRIWADVRSDRRVADFLVEADRRQSVRRFEDSHKVVTEHVYPPIPIRCYDWQATLDGYDEGDPLGQGATKAEAIADLREQI